MDKQTQTTQSPPSTCPTTTPFPADDPLLPTTSNHREEPPKTEETNRRESKRIKHCPSGCEAIIKSCSRNYGSSSFSFDPKYCSGATTPDVTPKFGSFNLAAAAAAAESDEKIVEKKADEDVGKSLIHQKRKIEELLEEVEGFRNAD